MDKQDIIRMAREAQSVYATETWTFALSANQLERFAALVAAHVRETEFKPDWMNYQQGLADGVAAEREACAKVCEQRSDPLGYANLTAEACAAAIRARGKA